jgi:integrase
MSATMSTTMSTQTLIRAPAQAPAQSQSPSLADRCIAAALSGLSDCSRRVYHQRIKAWLAWSGGTTGATALDRESVKAWLRGLEVAQSSPQVRNQALAALKKLAIEAGELGWIEHDAAVRIGAIKAKRISGVRTGLWLDKAQCIQLLLAPSGTTTIGRRDRAVLALLLGCGLRRSEACGCTIQQIEYRAGHMLLVNLVGKGGRIRSIAVPQWAQKTIEAWHKAAGIIDGYLLRSVDRGGTINGSLSAAAVRDIVKRYGTTIGVPRLRPHDLRRTYAKLSRLGGAPLETIQHSLGHASLKTTEIYTRTGEEANAGDYMDLENGRGDEPR